MEIGNATTPFIDQKASLILHGDSYVWGGIKAGGCNSDTDPFSIARPECAKKINVRGALNVFGKPRDTIRRVAVDARVGDTSITVNAPVDWRVFEKVVITGISYAGKHSLRLGMSGFRKTISAKETMTIVQVSSDGLTVTFAKPLSLFHSGTQINEYGVVIDTRDTVGLLDRNIEIKAGHSPLYDTVSGVSVESQGYGFTIHVLDYGYEPKPGWLDTDPNYATEGRRAMGVGRVHIEYAEFHDAGRL